jgi:hypothetical protein
LNQTLGIVLVIQGDKLAPHLLEEYCEEAIRRTLFQVKKLEEGVFRTKVNSLVEEVSKLGRDEEEDFKKYSYLLNE